MWYHRSISCLFVWFSGEEAVWSMLEGSSCIYIYVPQLFVVLILSRKGWSRRRMYLPRLVTSGTRRESLIGGINGKRCCSHTTHIPLRRNGVNGPPGGDGSNMATPGAFAASGGVCGVSYPGRIFQSFMFWSLVCWRLKNKLYSNLVLFFST